MSSPFSNEQISHKICHRVVELYELYRDFPERIEKERNIKLDPVISVLIDPDAEHESLRLMRSIARVIVKENEDKLDIKVSWRVFVDAENNVVFDLMSIEGNKWN